MQWEAPDFGTMYKAMTICKIPDLEDDAECEDRRTELQQAVDAHTFCLNTKLALYSCRAIERTVQRQYESLTEGAAIAGTVATSVPFELKPYSLISNKWLAAEWRWKDRGALFRNDPAGAAGVVTFAGVAVGLLALALGQLRLVRFRSRASREQDWIDKSNEEGVEQVQMTHERERRWLTMLHLQFLNAGIERFAVLIDADSSTSDIWTASNGADQCNQEDVTMVDVHRPTGVKLIVTNVPPRPDRAGWRFHIFFGDVQDAVRCHRPDTLVGKEKEADWSEFRTFHEIPWQRADIAMAVARRLLLRAMRGLEILNPIGAAVPKGWQPYPEEIAQCLKIEESGNDAGPVR